MGSSTGRMQMTHDLGAAAHNDGTDESRTFFKAVLALQIGPISRRNLLNRRLFRRSVAAHKSQSNRFEIYSIVNEDIYANDLLRRTQFAYFSSLSW